MSHPILLLNCGSSSIKYQLLDPEDATPLAVGIVQRIGLGASTITHEVGGEEFTETGRASLIDAWRRDQKIEWS